MPPWAHCLMPATRWSQSTSFIRAKATEPGLGEGAHADAVGGGDGGRSLRSLVRTVDSESGLAGSRAGDQRRLAGIDWPI